MTREEAIKNLKSKMDGRVDTSWEWCETIRMAIKALEQEPCGDAISRQAVINQIFYSTDNNGDVVLGSTLRERIARLPSVALQEPKTGH